MSIEGGPNIESPFDALVRKSVEEICNHHLQDPEIKKLIGDDPIEKTRAQKRHIEIGNRVVENYITRTRQILRREIELAERLKRRDNEKAERLGNRPEIKKILQESRAEIESILAKNHQENLEILKQLLLEQGVSEATAQALTEAVAKEEEKVIRFPKKQ